MSTHLEATGLALAGAAHHATLIAEGQLSARELTELHLERIARLDPELNAFRVVLGEQALADADAADVRRARGEGGSLNGVCVAIKDGTDVAGQQTPSGTAAKVGVAAADAPLVSRLRDAGAVVIGKTHVPELMICCFTETLTFGATRSPWDTNRTPGGSSGGSAAAVAAGLCGVAHGTDGAGSIRIPAAWCGLFGIKPQRGRIPIRPGDDDWHGMSVQGPLARTVADAALFLDVTAATGDTYASAAAREPSPLRIALATNLPAGVLARPSADALRAVEETSEHLRALGTPSPRPGSTSGRPQARASWRATSAGSRRTSLRSRIPSASSGARAASAASAPRSLRGSSTRRSPRAPAWPRASGGSSSRRTSS